MSEFNRVKFKYKDFYYIFTSVDLYCSLTERFKSNTEM